MREQQWLAVPQAYSFGWYNQSGVHAIKPDTAGAVSEHALLNCLVFCSMRPASADYLYCSWFFQAVERLHHGLELMRKVLKV